MENSFLRDISNYQKMLSADSTKELKNAELAINNLSTIQDSEANPKVYSNTELQGANLNKNFNTESNLQSSSDIVFDSLLGNLPLNSANTNATDKYTLQMLSSKDKSPEIVSNTVTFFKDPKDMQKADSFFSAISNWEETNQAKALTELTKPVYTTTIDSYGKIYTEKYFAGIGTNLGQLEASRANVASANLLLDALDNLLELNDHPLTDNTNNLYKSQVVSYENHLKGLDARVDPHDNSQSWDKFFSEIFSKETAKEIGNVLLDAVTSFGLSLAKSLLPSFKVVHKDPNELKDIDPFFAEYLDFKEAGYTLIDDGEVLSSGPYCYPSVGKEIRKKDDAEKELNSTLLKKFLGVEPVQGEEGNANNSSQESEEVKNERLAMSLLFDQLIGTNPLLGQHQFMLMLEEDWDFEERVVKDNLAKNFYFRIKNISVPEHKRPTVNSIYGYSGNNLLVNTQTSMERKAEMAIVCDRNFEVLEYLIRLSGLGVCETGEITEKNIDSPRTYNLSTISDTNNKLFATLGILNGRDLAKEFYMENPDWDFSKDGSTPTAKNLGLEGDTVAEKQKVIYAKLPYFTFENFRIINLNYNFKFDSTKIDSSLLEIKATVTWTRLQVQWLEAEDYFKDTIVTVTDS